MSWLHLDPVGLPGLAAFSLGGFAFLALLIAARLRARGDAVVETAGRSRSSIGGIVVQGIGIVSAGVGPLLVRLDPFSATALIEAAVVLGLMSATVALFHFSTLAMGKTWALVARTRADHELVQDGPFRIVRNPIYVALFLFMVAMAVAYGHTANLILGVPLFALGTWMRVSQEEVLLRRMFGAEYDAYAARVSRFVPGVL
jgi:protein-S-isoprenylcysteine O-methyltransferase Ste14